MPITNTEKLQHACNELAKYDYITIDTEFLREKTYHPVLCLVQLASEDLEYIVDPLAEGIDLAPLYELLANSKVTKVFHSGKQDIEIFYHATGKIPQNVFDTQITAMVCGFGAAASYASLVNSFVGLNLDKSSRFTDWSKRPLSEKQLEYAIGDVTHLRIIYKEMLAKLENSGRRDWVSEELSSLLSESSYHADLEKIWLKLCPKGCSAEFAGIIKGLVNWREKVAIEKNKPRGHVIKDATILEIAALVPKQFSDFDNIRGQNRIENNIKNELIEIIKSSNPEDAGKIKKNNRPQLASRHKPAIELLKVLLSQISQSNDVADRLIASSEDLSLIVLGEYDKTKSMKGWRYKVFGQHAKDLCEGKTALTFSGKKIKTVAVDNNI